MTTPTTYSQDAAVTALTNDRDTVMAALTESPPNRQTPYPVVYNPLGDDPMTLLDIVAHVIMWDEINLAVLTEARAGRAHWSLRTPWENPQAASALNAGGIVAGRLLTADLVIDRFLSVRAATIATIEQTPPEQWSAPLPFSCPGDDRSLAGLCGYVNTPESDHTGAYTYRHTVIHLGTT